jgi:uncharacterized protein YuzE
MKNIMEFKVIYDKNADVLYITTLHAAAERGIEDEKGLVWRYDRHGHALGCTIMDFAEYWYPERRRQLACELSRNLEIPATQIERVLDHAIGK